MLAQRKLFHEALRWLFALILVTTAVGKLLDNRGFAAVLGTYRLFPERSLLPLALTISLGELYVGLTLARRRFLAECAKTIVAINCGYFALAAITLYRGIPLTNCGCFGVFLARPLTPMTLVEDGVLVALSFAFLFLHGGLINETFGEMAPASAPVTRELFDDRTGT